MQAVNNIKKDTFKYGAAMAMHHCINVMKKDIDHTDDFEMQAMQRTCRTESLMPLSIYLQLTTNLIVVSFFASSWLSAMHLYVPLSSFLQLVIRNIWGFFPVPLFCLFPLNHVTRAGGLPPGPVHIHTMSSPTSNVK